MPDVLTLYDAVRVARKRAIEHALEAADNNRSRAAKLLGTDRSYLQRLMRELSISAKPPARSTHRPPRCSVCHKPGHDVRRHRP